MNEAELANVYKSNAELGEAEVARIMRSIADTQRFLQLITLIPGARELAESDPAGFHAKYGLDAVDLDEMKYLYDTAIIEPLIPLSQQEQLAALPESVFRYKQYLSNKLAYRNAMLNTVCVPENDVMKAWRARQIERVKCICGASYDANIHVPFNIELADGCSVGCAFCAAGARKLQKVFRHTDENAKLFSEVLAVAKDVVGPAAGAGVLYYGSEPLDDPDYEWFAEEYYRILGLYPQITTAVALRNVERTRALLHRLNEVPGTIHRFSLFSQQDVLRVLDAFTPLELLRVELLGQYEDAPCFTGFVSAGRAMEDDSVATGPVAIDSVCCVTGFVVNMANRTVRLITAANASERYPLGEILYETAAFTDAESLRANMERMIKTYMPASCPKDLPLHLYPYIRLERDEQGNRWLKSRAYGVRLDKLAYWRAEEVVEAMTSGSYTKSELAKKLYAERGIAPEKTYWVVALLWRKGIIDELYQA